MKGILYSIKEETGVIKETNTNWSRIKMLIITEEKTNKGCPEWVECVCKTDVFHQIAIPIEELRKNVHEYFTIRERDAQGRLKGFETVTFIR